MVGSTRDVRHAALAGAGPRGPDPAAARPGAVLVDGGCGELLAPHVDGLGYRLVGVDLTRSALVQAAEHGVTAVQGDASVLPLADGCANVVCAGEILEHVVDLRAAVREACRVLRPGGVLVVDTIAATFLARLLVITVAERIPRAAPPGLHDPALFVDRQVLISECARHGVRLQLNGLRPGAWSLLRWLRRRQPTARMVRTWSTAVLFQGRGTKGDPPRNRVTHPAAFPSLTHPPGAGWGDCCDEGDAMSFTVEKDVMVPCGTAWSWRPTRGSRPPPRRRPCWSGCPTARTCLSCWPTGWCRTSSPWSRRATRWCTRTAGARSGPAGSSCRC